MILLSLNPDLPFKGVIPKGFDAYEKGDYKKAASYFTNAIYTTGESDIQFYVSQAHIGNGKYQEAIKALDPITARSKYYYHTLWYKILLRLKLGETDKAINLLENYLLFKDVFKQKEAQELREILDQMISQSE